MTPSTYIAALQSAIRLFPHDLVGRLAYIEMKRDTCDIENLGAWNEAAQITRNGTPRKGAGL